ncbi:MAG: MBL fold metallo-hydrolase, partial [Phycisphaerales bacterium]|nr:MBL fold metallo-hydrolase [Phycisphaerales bacterium]
PDPHAMGPSIAIVGGGRAFLVDAGAGVVRRAAEAFERGEKALAVDRLDTVFLTHLHSDHTLGLPDLLLTPWVVGREKPLTVIGPKGSKKMVESISQAWSEDIHVRLEGGEGGNRTGYQAVVREIEPGVVFRDGAVEVTAFRVPHGSWSEAFGYRFDTPGRSIVVSGDTAADPEQMQRVCNGCDVLIHEVFAGRGIIENSFTEKKLGHAEADWATYMAKFHTSARDLGRIAQAAKPKLLIVHHTILLGGATEEDLVREIRVHFDGRIEVARDLSKY